MPRTTIVEIPPAEQTRMRAELRCARYGYLLALHLLLLCTAGRTPSEVAAVLFCSYSSVYRVARAYRASTLTFDDATEEAARQRRLRLLTPRSNASSQPCSRVRPVPLDGVARGGAVRHWPWRSTSGEAFGCRRRPCATSCMSWAGNGNAPS